MAIFRPPSAASATPSTLPRLGVGIVSTYPRQGLRALDGTSMASPHVAGLVALYLAHHSALRSLPRSPTRLDLLCELLCRQSFALPFGPERVGYGMPLAPQPTSLAALMLYAPLMQIPLRSRWT